MDEQPRSTPARRSPKQEAILQAASQVFRDEGYETASMDRIAEVAGVSKRTVYNHFSSKELLFQRIVADFVMDMTELKQITFDAQRSLEDQLLDFVRAEVALVSNPRWLGLVKVLLAVFLRNPEYAVAMNQRYQGGDSALEEWIRRAMDAGRLRQSDVGVATRVFSALLAGAYTWPAVLSGTPTPVDPSLGRELVETFLSRYRP